MERGGQQRFVAGFADGNGLPLGEGAIVIDVGNGATVVEVVVAQQGQAVGQADDLQTLTVVKDRAQHFCNALGDLHLRQAGAAAERESGQLGETGGKRECGQPGAVFKGSGGDGGDGVGDDELRQAGAAVKGGIADGGEPLGKRQPGQAGAVLKRVGIDRFQSCRKRQIRQRRAAVEGVNADESHAVADLHGLQIGEPGAAVFGDGGDGAGDPQGVDAAGGTVPGLIRGTGEGVSRAGGAVDGQHPVVAERPVDVVGYLAAVGSKVQRGVQERLVIRLDDADEVPHDLGASVVHVRQGGAPVESALLDGGNAGGDGDGGDAGAGQGIAADGLHAVGNRQIAVESGSVEGLSADAPQGARQADPVQRRAVDKGVVPNALRGRDGDRTQLAAAVEGVRPDGDGGGQAHRLQRLAVLESAFADGLQGGHGHVPQQDAG